MAGKTYKFVGHTSAISACLEDGVAALVELGEECRTSAENFPNQDHPKAQAFGEAADALENVSLDVDLPEELASVEVGYREAVPKRKGRAPGRAVRCSNACAAIQAGIEGLQAWLDDDANKDHDRYSEVEQLVSEAEGIVSDAEGVEFPGLFG